ncbi:hypothetical protein NIES2098_55120 [Calothrix sp. NIES-2098]|nr:hypothetical protein NIES2098_55120 [Calothrix sp. NIES-2098]
MLTATDKAHTVSRLITAKVCQTLPLLWLLDRQIPNTILEIRTSEMRQWGGSRDGRDTSNRHKFS